MKKCIEDHRNVHRNPYTASQKVQNSDIESNSMSAPSAVVSDMARGICDIPSHT